MRRAILWLMLMFSPVAAKADSSFSHEPQVLQDPKTKIIYYLESDRRHVAAISPDGKLLWCVLIIPTLKNYPAEIQEHFHVASISFRNENELNVSVIMMGGGGGTIDKKTGAFDLSKIMWD